MGLMASALRTGYQRRNPRDGEEKCRNPQNYQRIAGPILDPLRNHLIKTETECKPQNNSQTHAGARRYSHDPKHIPPLSPESNANPQFTRALQHRIRNNAVQAHRREDQR